MPSKILLVSWGLAALCAACSGLPALTESEITLPGTGNSTTEWIDTSIPFDYHPEHRRRAVVGETELFIIELPNAAETEQGVRLMHKHTEDRRRRSAAGEKSAEPSAWLRYKEEMVRGVELAINQHSVLGGAVHVVSRLIHSVSPRIVVSVDKTAVLSHNEVVDMNDKDQPDHEIIVGLLSSLHGVHGVQRDRNLEGVKLERRILQSSLQNNLDSIDNRDYALNDFAYYYTSGDVSNYQKLVMVVIDSGLNEHQEFDGMRVQRTAMDGFNTPEDQYGHGTAVASNAVGFLMGTAHTQTARQNDPMLWTINASNPLTGLYPFTVVVTAMDSVQREYEANGSCDKSYVVNLSLAARRDSSTSSDVMSDYIRQMVEYNKANYPGCGQIHFTVAAGNESDDACMYTPAFMPEVITVGGLESSTPTVAGFSNRGSCVDISANGVTGAAHYEGYTSYGTYTGTSFSAPLVAGTLLNILSENPRMDSNELRGRMLQDSAGTSRVHSITYIADGVNCPAECSPHMLGDNTCQDACRTCQGDGGDCTCAKSCDQVTCTEDNFAATCGDPDTSVEPPTSTASSTSPTTTPTSSPDSSTSDSSTSDSSTSDSSTSDSSTSDSSTSDSSTSDSSTSDSSATDPTTTSTSTDSTSSGTPTTEPTTTPSDPTSTDSSTSTNSSSSSDGNTTTRTDSTSSGKPPSSTTTSTSSNSGDSSTDSSSTDTSTTTSTNSSSSQNGSTNSTSSTTTTTTITDPTETNPETAVSTSVNGGQGNDSGSDDPDLSGTNGNNGAGIVSPMRSLLIASSILLAFLV
eukprot:Clim_evm82s215 gene=Clim_evmTU82s215